MKHIFVTGITGVLGSALGPVLLQSPQHVLHVLIRAEDHEHAQMRLQDLWSFWGDEVSESMRSRIHVYCGDAARPQFGLDAETYHSLLSTITHIIHSAASVKLDMDESEALEKVYKPSKTVLDFAMQIHESGRLQKLEYISTLGVAGKMSGSIPETVLPARDFHNNYERTKARSEVEALELYKQKKLPVTIHRPSMIIGHSKTGKIVHFQGFYFLCSLFTGYRTKGLLPKLPQLSFDLIPCDYVAQAVYLSLESGNETAGHIFHLCSGPDLSLPYHDLVKYLRFYHTHYAEKLPHTILVPPSLFLCSIRMMALFSWKPKFKRAAKNIALYFNHIKTIQMFENTQTIAFLETRGLALDHPENYLRAVLDYHRFKVRNDMPN
ncbi:MAG: SDR family oxidoreductase [Alphaproteobacteria bacterium]|nr:SDR family oxidoreductase [Alphaproteobacteria bacterium]